MKIGPGVTVLLLSLSAREAGSEEFPRVRFANTPTVWEMNDQESIPEPREMEWYRLEDIVDKSVTRQITRWMEIPVRTHARDVNALEKVPNSSWFVNRHPLRPMSPEEAARGPMTDSGPETPWTVVSGKFGGATPGFQIVDARGIRYLIKPDEAGFPELKSGANIVSNRLLYASGYFVPEDSVAYFKRDDLALSPSAKANDSYGRSVPMTEPHLDDILSRSYHTADGRYRAVASKFLAGKPKGSFTQEGVRPDDPNDTIPHQHRRSLRGLGVIGAWINHVDFTENQSLDMYVEEEGRRYLRHYLIDFAATLGAPGVSRQIYWYGNEYYLDPETITVSLISLGFWVKPWEMAQPSDHPQVAYLYTDLFDPSRWRPSYPNLFLQETTDEDAFWGASITAAFSDAQIEAVVGEGQYTDPGAEALIIRALGSRRDKIARYWFSRVNPLDDFRYEAGRLCYKDLGVEYAGFPMVDRRYLFRSRAVIPDRGWDVSRLSDGVCLDVPATPDVSYLVVGLRTFSGDGAVGKEIQVHLRRGDNGSLRILGIDRGGP